MAKPNRDPHGGGLRTRLMIADLAARFMVEHGIRDYAHAKRKAARQLNLPNGHTLPSNEEIDQAMIERQSLYEPEEQAELLESLRHEALEVMEVFARFQPVLTGAVASGAVGEYSLIDLDIQAESSKEFEQFLHNERIEFKLQDRNGQMAYLIYAEPTDVNVRMISREGRYHSAGRPQLTLEQLRRQLRQESLVTAG